MRKLNAKIDYACKALVDLAFHWPSTNPVQITTIAENQRIPVRFLTHIMIQLKHLGLVKSIRGKSGGYILAKHPGEINLNQVVDGFDAAAHSAAGAQSRGHEKHIMDDIWQEIDRSLLKGLEKITFEEICNRKRSRDKTLTFEI